VPKVSSVPRARAQMERLAEEIRKEDPQEDPQEDPLVPKELLAL